MCLSKGGTQQCVAGTLKGRTCCPAHPAHLNVTCQEEGGAQLGHERELAAVPHQAELADVDAIQPHLRATSMPSAIGAQYLLQWAATRVHGKHMSTVLAPVWHRQSLI